MDKIWSHVKAEFLFSPKQYNTIIYLTTLLSESTSARSKYERRK